ncbi:hypothetical protein FS595_07055 [Serratia rubidaea]|uniref:hypothetical protein n=1 Tax=Serratia rubidaea TaxID=61652 RepID=UPI001F27452A|nr:hypothetical protein [Serratia rubidaea]UJD79468.1 hypothetical protein FS596_07055 [Serratia rubidaea]UJD84023.1 hypothetical protein FS595_07055 [Serratia rubidaea]
MMHELITSRRVLQPPVWAFKSAKGYQAYDDGPFAYTKNAGNLTSPNINMFIRSIRGTPESIRGSNAKLQAQFGGNMVLGQAPGLSGKPVFMVMPQQGASPANTMALLGAVSSAQRPASIVLAAGKAS